MLLGSRGLFSVLCKKTNQLLIFRQYRHWCGKITFVFSSNTKEVPSNTEVIQKSKIYFLFIAVVEIRHYPVAHVRTAFQTILQATELKNNFAHNV